MSGESWLGLVGAPEIQDEDADPVERRKTISFVGCTVEDDEENERTIVTPPGATPYTDEQAQDAVGDIFVSTATIAPSYSDATPSYTWNVVDGSITPTKLATVATSTIRGRVTAGTGAVENLTGTQATTLLDVAGALKGLMSAADKTKLDAATASATVSTLALRDGSGNSAFIGITCTSLAGGGTVATTGLVRGANNVTLVAARNQADSGDLAVLATNTSNQVVINGSTQFDNTGGDSYYKSAAGLIVIDSMPGGGQVWLRANSVTKLAVTTTVVDLTVPLQVDTVNEHTGAAGVTVDGLLIKDNRLDAAKWREHLFSYGVDDGAAGTPIAEKIIGIPHQACTVVSARYENDAVVTGDDANNATLKVWRRNGSATQAAVASLTTDVASGGLAAWISKSLGALTNTALAADESLTIEVTKTGTGARIRGTFTVVVTYD